MPTTVFGDLLHVFLGPFSGLVTGLLSGVLQYLLIMALLMLYRRQGILALLLLLRYLLSAVLFGHVTPLGLMSCAVSAVFLEGVIWLSGLAKQETIEPWRAGWAAVLFGLADSAASFINLEQMMFFYRLYYADWYIGLYMIVNGFIYSTAGAWLGYGVGKKLRQITGD